jgi:hypothetical protein
VRVVYMCADDRVRQTVCLCVVTVSEWEQQIDRRLMARDAGGTWERGKHTEPFPLRTPPLVVAFTVGWETTSCSGSGAVVLLL